MLSQSNRIIRYHAVFILLTIHYKPEKKKQFSVFTGEMKKWSYINMCL